MTSTLGYWFIGLDLRSAVTLVFVATTLVFALVVGSALVITSKRLANTQIPFAIGRSPFSILYQQYRFVVDGPGLIREGYARYSDGLFEIPRTFRCGQVILCKPQLIEELRNTRSVIASSEPWIDQLLQISHVMPGYFPKGGGWPPIAKTTPGIIRGTVHKHLDRYMPSMQEAIRSQLRTLQFKDEACSVSCFDFAYSIVARSGSFAMVGRQLAHNEEYLKAIKDHILGMIMTTRVQFMVPECLKKYIGGFISGAATWGTRWDMNASRRILLKHFDARAAEYDKDIANGAGDNEVRTNSGLDEEPVEIFRWLYESSVLRGRWTYSEVIGEMLLLQFAFVYTTAYSLYGALAEIARRPEYIKPLREEVEFIFSKLETTVADCDKMVLLDSFLKECQRLHPPAAVSAHRVCVTPLALSNGVILKPGTHVGVPSDWIQRSSQSYVDPEMFDGFRFVKLAATGASDTRLVDLSPDYLVFGMGVHACPGRWMATALMKLVFAHLIMHFDILPDSAQGPLTGSLSFEEFYVPNFKLKLRLQRRDEGK